MLRNSLPRYDDIVNETQQPLLLNTSTLNAENLQNCIAITNEIERQEQIQQLHRRLSHPTPLQANITYEEIYDCSFEDDRFLSALEYQNSPNSQQITDLDASQLQLGDAMKYFDEDVNVDSGTSRADTPTRLPVMGTVAAAVANFQTQLSKSMGSPPPPYKEHASPSSYNENVNTEKYSTIQELRKKYEEAAAKEQAEKTLRENQQKAQDQRRSAPSAIPVPIKKEKRQKSKVKQMAHMFNTKIVQLMRRDSSSKKRNTQLDATQMDDVASTTKPVISKPLPKPRSRLPIYRNGLPSPVPSPRFKRRHQKNFNNNNNNNNNSNSQQSSDSEGACLIAEDVFRKLSVKDKALLYNKFIEDMTKQHPQFDVHARFVEAHVQQELKRSEKAEKTPKVREIARELEARFNSATTKISPWALKRLAELQKMPEYEAATKLIAPMSPSTIEAAVLSSMAKKGANNAKDDDESETDVENVEMHVSTLTVVLKASCENLSSKQRAIPRILPRKEREQRFINDMRMIERTQKRNNESMRSSISFEACGPPKKIRRTRAERLQPKAIFQNAYMERMFYNWIMEKNGVTFDITTLENSEDSLCANGDEANTSKSSVKSKSKVHMLLEKAISKLGRDNTVKRSEKVMKIINENRNQQEELVEQKRASLDAQQAQCKPSSSSDEIAPPALPNRPQRKVKRQAPQPPTTTAAKAKETENVTNQERLSTSSSKLSEAESESGLSSLPKITSDESTPEQTRFNTTIANATADLEYAMPNRSARKKKLRRTLTWKKDSCIVECRSVPSTTDSESDHKARDDADKEAIYANIALNVKKSPISNRDLSNEIKEMTEMAETQTVEHKYEKSTKEVENFLNSFNTPQKLQSTYTLTAMSTPTPNTESDRATPITESDREQLKQRNITTPDLIAPKVQDASRNREKIIENEKSSKNIKKERTDNMQNLIDSFTDLGFETGSNDSPSRRSPPVPAPRRSKPATPLFIKLTPDLDKTMQQNRSNFSSTPIRGYQSQPQIFSSNVARQLQQQLQQQQQHQQQYCISPIGTLNGSRRRSIQIDDSRRASIAMQVISEDRPLEQVERTETPLSPTTTDTSFFGNSFNFNMSLNTNEHIERTSKFWIRIDDFTVSLDVFYNAPDRLRLLYDIFCQKSCETRDLHFGIDDHKFSIHNPSDKADISTRLPKITGCSHYWFSTGDLAVPFNGKYLPAEKIERLFNFIDDSMTDRTQLRFGIDEFEFSSVPENWSNSPKFSMESSYSMLLGLQGSSSGMEGRSRFAWPNSLYSSAHSNTNSIKTNDIDFSEFGSEFDNSEIQRLTDSPCGSNYFDLASSMDSEDMIMPRQSNILKRDQYFNDKFEIESLDKLFEEDQKNAKNIPSDKKTTLSIPEMLKKLQEQKVKLSDLEKRLRTYSNHSGMAGAILPHSKELPIYMRKLRNIIKAIDNIGRGGDGFKSCSIKQLDSFIFFLTRYADITLANCNDHMNKVLDVLLDQQQKQQYELMKSNT